MKTVYLLIGPKGSGKSHIGGIIQKQFGIRFLSVEPYFIRNHNPAKLIDDASFERTWDEIFNEIESHFQAYNSICFESTGTFASFRLFLSKLKRKYKVIFIRIAAPLSICRQRIKARDQAAHIPFDDRTLRKIHSLSLKASYPFSLTIDNRNSFETRIVRCLHTLFPYQWHTFRKRRKGAIIIPFAYYFISYNKKNTGFNLNRHIHILESGWQHELIESKNFHDIASYLCDRYMKDHKLLDNCIYESRRVSEKFVAFCRSRLCPEALIGCSDRELILHLKRFFKLYNDFSNINIPPWMFASEEIESRLRAKNIKPDIISLLSMPEANSYLSVFEKELYKLLSAIKQKRLRLGNYEAFIADLSMHNLLGQFKSIIADYFWILFDYQGPDLLDSMRLYHMLKEDTKSAKGIREKIEEIDNYPRTIRQRQQAIAATAHLDYEATRLLELLRKTTVLQDMKKKYTTIEHYYLFCLLKEISGRLDYSVDELYFLYLEEIESLLMNGKNYRNEIAKRKKKCVAVFTTTGKSRIHIYTGRRADDYLKMNNLKWISEEKTAAESIVKGYPASKGCAKGRAVVMHSATECPKVAHGDIIVAAMTTPDYFPALKRAAAIVTDEGGITCHAAIVSRELGIPCVIGTGMATSAFNDGDIVEVNGDLGTARKVD